jgi:hypothetical protein
MDSLPPPARDNDLSDIAIALAVVERGGVVSGYEASDEELQAVLQLYDDYDACGGIGGAVDFSHLNLDLVKTIKNGFGKTYFGGALYHIRNRIKASVTRCPICAIGAAKELDHYLTKADFKVFAIYVRNLVPICHDCNNSKGTHGTDVAHERFIHAYFDDVPEEHLSVDLKLEGGGLITNFGVPDLGVTGAEIEQRIRFQLGRLNLSDRWSDEVIVYLSAHETALENAFEAEGANGVATFLGKQADKEERRYGKSSWRPVLLRALSASDEFCDEGFLSVLMFED